MSKNLYRVVTFLITFFAITTNNTDIDLYVFIHCLVIAVSSFSLFSFENKPYSLYKVFHIFTIFFFGVAPVLQYHENIRFDGEPIIPKDIKMTASVIVLITTLLFNMIYMVVYNFSKNKKTKAFFLKLNGLNLFNNKFKFSTNLFLICLSLFSLFMMLYVKGFNVMKLLFRGGEIAQSSGGETFSVNKSIGLLTNQFVRPIPLIVFIISCLYNKKQKALNFLLFLIFIITCSPTGLARNATASFYLPLLLLFIPFFQKKNMFVSVMIGGLLVVFPFLNNFRRYSAGKKLAIGVDYEMFLDLHFDAYMTFCRILNLDLITYGNQLLGVLFFFIPRSIWENKPESSGYYHAEVLNLNFKNLACTYLAEGYINFGYIGVFVFLIFLAWACAKFDKIFWSFKRKNTYMNVLYVLVLGTLLFILRGDLMNGFAYTVGVLMAAIVVYKLVVLSNKINFK